MQEKTRTYIAIDLKSFYASAECVARGLDPLSANLVVADASRTEKTICLAVSPSLKAYGIPGRPRLFEVVQQVERANRERLSRAPGHRFTGRSADDRALRSDPSLAIDYLIAPPRMAYYMQCSARVYEVYLRFAAAEDIHVYSVDEVFLDATDYLSAAGMTAEQYARAIVAEIVKETGITATAGIGSNLYLAKVALDIVAKHIPPDGNGARIAALDEMRYRETLWSHRPLTDFWRVGKGYAKKLEERGLYTMGDIARCSLGSVNDFYNEDLLYRLFGVNAELLIDHAWGWEPCTIADIKAYRPQSESIGAGQVLAAPYPFEKARLVAGEIAESIALDLVKKELVCDQVVMTVGYDVDNPAYHGERTTDRYGRKIPPHAHGTEHLLRQTSSAQRITDAFLRLFDRIVKPQLAVRRMYLAALHVLPKASAARPVPEQLSLFSDAPQEDAAREDEAALEREQRRQKAVLAIKEKYGKNAILKGKNYEDGATAKERNDRIGGHKA